ncbi:hypothetical protein [Roseateles amylovorans]|uniref:Uncharacterized protein n=1 Tax=Roseateles amylovorans TaxID=2978473 RepID=A0ABY6AT51_9BURK|nr:hypothetical protein [Roseateles amylovorans]UXH76197.1 hypothetical protein N4261_14075 [Roseateles amylovorans]
MQRFEYLSALWETMASAHIGCGQVEAAAAMGQYGGFEFKCPVAAALLQCGLALGVPAAIKGEWPQFRSSVTRSCWLPNRECPPWGTEALTREQSRLFVLSALEHLASVSKRGWSEALWRRAFAPEAKAEMASGELMLSGLASDDQLLKAFQEAGESCAGFQPEIEPEFSS